MAEGNSTYKGLAVPLNGESEIVQQTAANDIITLTGATSQSGDFLVCQNSSGTELFVIDSNGYPTIPGRMALGSAITTAPTTGLTKGDLILFWEANTAPVLGVCVSTATNDIKYISPFDTETAGRTT